MTATDLNPTPSAATAVEKVSLGRGPRVLLFLGRYGTPLVLLLLIIVFSILDGGAFFSFSNAKNILTQSTISVVIALGLTVVLIAGELDLSVGYTASFVCMLTAGHFGGSPLQQIIVVICAIGVGVLVGVVNGLVVAKLGVNAIIGTLGVGSVVIGVNYLVTGGAPLPVRPDGVDLVQFYLSDIPWPIILIVVLTVVMWLFHNRTTLGLEIRAVGGNRTAAWYSGIRVDRVVIVSFIICGGLAGLGGILITANIGSGQVTGGDGFLLSSFAACFLGSAALRDGEFHVLGTLLGVLTIAVGDNGLAILGVGASAQFVFEGVLLVAAVGMSTAARRIGSGDKVLT